MTITTKFSTSRYNHETIFAMSHLLLNIVVLPFESAALGRRKRLAYPRPTGANDCMYRSFRKVTCTTAHASQYIDQVDNLVVCRAIHSHGTPLAARSSDLCGIAAKLACEGNRAYQCHDAAPMGQNCNRRKPFPVSGEALSKTIAAIYPAH